MLLLKLRGSLSLLFTGPTTGNRKYVFLALLRKAQNTVAFRRSQLLVVVVLVVVVVVVVVVVAAAPARPGQ